METFDTLGVCSSCGNPTDQISGMGEYQPKTGDPSMCFRCGHLTVLEVNDGEVTQREPTAQESADFTSDPYLQAVEAIRKEMW